MHTHRARIVALILASVVPAHAHDPPAAVEVTVQGEQAIEAASHSHTGHKELELRPKSRPADLVETVPGLIAVQHAGGGKANQWFLRGFDADHGTDVAFFVDGIPINFVSHGHGQGYTDLHFLIPELAVSVDGYKGPYYARFADFATAGAVELRLAEVVPESYAQYTHGQYGIRRGLIVASPQLGDSWRAVTAAEIYGQDGPFVHDEHLGRYNVFLRATHDLDLRSKVSMTFMSYGSRWNGSGQIPARAVCGEGEVGVDGPEAFGEPCLDHFGSVDPSEGGASQRHIASLSYAVTGEDTGLSVLAYLQRYRFNLYSNFTFFQDDPILGDQIEQTDDRTVFGTNFAWHRHATLGPVKFTTTLGGQVRADVIENALYHDAKRERLSTTVDADISETQLGAYLQEEVRPASAVRFVIGGRVDRIDVSVDDQNEDTATLGSPTSGTAAAARFSPKFMTVVSPLHWLDVFADYGWGFHSNDARGAVQANAPADLMTPAVGYEVGLQLKPLRGLQVSAAAFLLDLDSELVWSGDAGSTEPSAGTRRMGLEFDARYNLANWFFADAAATFTRARYRGLPAGANAVPLAPTQTLSAGLGVQRKIEQFTPFAALRLRVVGDRPANETSTLTADGSALLGAEAGLRWRMLEARIDGQNLLGSTWREVSFANTSQLPYEPAPVEGIHYTPGWPRTIMGSLRLYWQ